MTEADPHGWFKFSVRWPADEDCDIYGNIEISHMGARSFTTIGDCESFQYNLKRSAWWRTPTPLPYITG